MVHGRWDPQLPAVLHPQADALSPREACTSPALIKAELCQLTLFLPSAPALRVSPRWGRCQSERHGSHPPLPLPGEQHPGRSRWDEQLRFTLFQTLMPGKGPVCRHTASAKHHRQEAPWTSRFFQRTWKPAKASATALLFTEELQTAQL